MTYFLSSSPKYGEAWDWQKFDYIVLVYNTYH